MAFEFVALIVFVGIGFAVFSGSRRVPKHLIDIHPVPLVIIVSIVAAAVFPKLMGNGTELRYKYAAGDVRTGLPSARIST